MMLVQRPKYLSLAISLIVTTILLVSVHGTSHNGNDRVGHHRYASTATVVNVTNSYEISNDFDYHYMVTLSEPNWSSEATDDEPSIVFYWKAPSKINDNELSGDRTKRMRKIQCRLVHESTPLLSSRISWLGFGILTMDLKKLSLISSDNTNSNVGLMIGSNALIAFPNDDHGGSHNNIDQYILKKSFDTDGGVEEYKSAVSGQEDKPLFMENDSYIKQKTLPDSRVVTTFDFSIVLYNNDDKVFQSSNSMDETFVRERGDNLFLFAVGPPTAPPPESNRIGAPAKIGSFVLDFNEVGTSKEMSYVKEQTNCTSDDARYENMLALPGHVKFYWTLDSSSDLIDIQLSHLGNSWLAFGIAEDENGRMINADAVICRPAFSAIIDEKPLKYHLSSFSQDGVYPMAGPKQTLTDTSCVQDEDEDFDETILRFTKKLKEDGENPISRTNVTTFLYAVGGGNILTKHTYANSFYLNVNECPINSDIINDAKDYRLLWIAHGVFGTLAFAIAFPSSITFAFLRELMPTSWIFFHVYGNLAAFILTFITFSIAVSTTISRGGEHFTESHHKIGLALLLLSIFQIIGGVFRPDKPTRQNNIRHPWHRTKRSIWKWFHHVLGITILSFGLYQVGDGLSMYAEDYEAYSLAPIYFVMLAICIISVSGTKLWLSVFGDGGPYAGDGAETEVENLQNGSRFPETEMI